MLRKSVKIVSLISLIAMAGLLLPSTILAADAPTVSSLGSVFGTATLSQLIVRLVQIFLGISGVIALILVMYGGYVWMMANGDPAKVDKAKSIIYSALIGLIIIFSAFAIASWVYGLVSPCTPGQPGCNIESCDPSVSDCGNNCIGSACIDPFGGTYKKYANIYSFTDPNLPGLNIHSSRTSTIFYVVQLPSSESLQVRGYAQSDKNQYGSIAGIKFIDRFGSSTMALSSPIEFSYQGALLSAADGSSVWNTSSTDYAAYFSGLASTTIASTTAKIVAQTDKLAIFSSNILKVRFWPQHCFDGKTNSDETGRDCGGSCPNCDGTSCLRPGSTVCDSANCASGYCGEGCICASRPVITYISPAKDVASNTILSRLTGVDDDIANGAPGNYITIYGRNFGDNQGSVLFISKTDPTNQITALIAPCADAWSRNKIVAIIPASASAKNISSDDRVVSSSDAFNYDVVVNTNVVRGSDPWPFQVNKINRPGLCSLSPTSGIYPASTTASGNNFPTASPRGIDWLMAAQSKSSNDLITIWYPYTERHTTSTAWNGNSAIDVIPENSRGRSNVSIWNGLTNSNSIPFLISAGTIGEPCGFDDLSCSDDKTTCRAGLTCYSCNPTDKNGCDRSKNCTCQKASLSNCTIDPNNSARNVSSTPCSVGNCPGEFVCEKKSEDYYSWSNCQIKAPKAGEAKCIPYLTDSFSSIFAWPFFAIKNNFNRCVDELWGDSGSCNINGCVDKNTFCNPQANAGWFIELFNGSGAPQTIAKIIYSDHREDFSALAAYYDFEKRGAAAGSNDSSIIADQRNNANLSYSNVTESTIDNWLFGRVANFTSGCASTANSAPQVKGSFTVTAFVKSSSLASKAGIIASAGDSSHGWQFGVAETGGKLKFAVNDSSTAEAEFSGFGGKLATDSSDKLIPVAAVFEAGKGIRLFYNGSQVASADAKSVTAINYAANSVFSVGCQGNVLNFPGQLDEVRIYNQALSNSQIAAIASFPKTLNEMSLAASLTINNGAFGLISSTTAARLRLSQAGGYIGVVASDGTIADSVNYSGTAGGSQLFGLAPFSFGRKTDGLNTNRDNDFQTFVKPTPGARNSNDSAKATSQALINEVSIAVDACTCMPNISECRSGQIDTSSCEPLNGCAYVRSCDENLHWTTCHQANPKDPKCLKYLAASSTLATYAWGFVANSIPSSLGPMVVVDCSRTNTCNPNDRLPSPAPWDLQWNTDINPSLDVTNSLACKNAVIFARFTEAMDAGSLTTSNIKLYKQDGASWTDVTSQIRRLEPLSTGRAAASIDAFEIKMNNDLQADSKYKVYLDGSIADELGRKLVEDPRVGAPKITHSYCQGLALPASSTALCWEFNTRSSNDPDLKCKIGCVNCAPTKYFGRYFLEQKQHQALPFSADNVCMMLDGSDYSWLWDEQEQKMSTASSDRIESDLAVWYRNWIEVASGQAFLPTFASKYPWPFSFVTEMIDFIHIIDNFTVRGNDQSITTAYLESNWRPYQADNSYFTEQDTDFFRIVSKETQSQNFGQCWAHNNFTDPIVEENQFCYRGKTPEETIPQSPSPWKGSTDACTNSAVFVLFSRNMQNTSLINPDAGMTNYGKLKNIYVYECDNSTEATSSDATGFVNASNGAVSSSKGSCKLVSNEASKEWKAKIFNYNHANISMAELSSLNSTMDDSLKPEGIEIYPNSMLSANKWYKIIIKGGPDGVRGGTASGTAALAELSDGIFQNPYGNAKLHNVPGEELYPWYYWYFKTTNAQCPIDFVNVLPQVWFMPRVGAAQEYSADPWAANCNHLNPFSYSWYWKSLSNAKSDALRCYSSLGGDIDDYGIAHQVKIGVDTSSGVFSSDFNNHSPFSKIYGLANSLFDVTAIATSTGNSCIDFKYGYGKLQIGTEDFSIQKIDNTDCTNPIVDVNYTTEYRASTSIAGTNVKMFECNSADASCAISNSTSVPIKITYPAAAGTPSAEPALSKKMTIEPDAILKNGFNYRIWISGGYNGPVSYNGKKLSGLNYSASSNKGEACDPSVEPWKSEGTCSGNCKLSGSANLCGKASSQCDSQGVVFYAPLNVSEFHYAPINHDFDDIMLNIEGRAKLTDDSMSVAGKFLFGIRIVPNNYVRYQNVGIDIKNALTSNTTYSLWAKVNDCDAAKKSLITRNISADGSGTNGINIYATANSNNYCVIGAIGKNGSASANAISAVNVRDNKWHLVNLVLDRANSKFQLYVDGLSAPNQTISDVGPVSAGDLYIGSDVSGQSFDGNIDEFLIYNKAFAAGDIAKLFKATSAYSGDILCDSTCHRIGNSNAVGECGNGILERGEACDDGNLAANDGCNPHCLNEGSADLHSIYVSQYPSKCGNGIIEKGEDCDLGRDDNGKHGCSSNCTYQPDYASSAKFLAANGTTTVFGGFNCNTADYGTIKQTTTITVIGTNGRPIQQVVKIGCNTPLNHGCTEDCRPAGTPMMLPFCGNGKIEQGEECDEGDANGKAGSTCSADCLRSGNSSYGNSSGECGNGFLDNGAADSYSWVFHVSDTAKVCRNAWWDVNNCPNGIWTLHAGTSISGLKVSFYKGSAVNNSSNSCLSNSEFGKLSFWRSIIRTLIAWVKNLLGFKTAIAANFWCPISPAADLQFDSAAIASMKAGNYKASTTVDGIGTEVIGYTDEQDNLVLQFIRDKSFDLNAEYKQVAIWDRSGVVGTSTGSVKTLDAVCKMDHITFDVWPRGQSRSSDSFFCASDPKTGNPDDCGRYGDSLVAQDMSANWTKDFPGNGYNIDATGTAPAVGNYRDGNNHLYRAWARDKFERLLRANFDQTLANLGGTKTTTTHFAAVKYSGAFWATSGFVPGRSMFHLEASDTSESLAGAAKGDLMIYTFFCNNPWPDAKNFPFCDNGGNCTNGNASCINTNFCTFYCRDAGVAKTCASGDASKIGKSCDNNSSCFSNKSETRENSCRNYTADDLPSIANYDASHDNGDGTFGRLTTGVAIGQTGEECQNLPNTFVPKAGYYSNLGGEDRVYLWNSSGEVYYRGKTASLSAVLSGSEKSGWIKLDKGEWQRRGLPAGFVPNFGYYAYGKVTLFGTAAAYSFDGTSWIKDTSLMSALPKGFWPRTGYYNSSLAKARLIDGSAKFVDVDSSSHVSASASFEAFGNAPIRAASISYFGYLGWNAVAFDVSGNLFYYNSTDGNWYGGQTVNSQEKFPVTASYYDQIDGKLVIWQGNKAYYLSPASGLNWLTEADKNTSDVICDNKVKEFLFSRGGIGAVNNEIKIDPKTYDPGNQAVSARSAAGLDNLWEWKPQIASDALGGISMANGKNSNDNSTCTLGDGSALNPCSMKPLVYKNVFVPNDGKYYVYLRTTGLNGGLIDSLPSSMNGTYGNCKVVDGKVLQTVQVEIGGQAGIVTSTASNNGDLQANRADATFTLAKGNYELDLQWLDDCFCDSASNPTACSLGTVDSNLRIAGISLIPASESDILDAIGIRVYNNNNHYAPAEWYANRFRTQQQGSTQKLVGIDGYSAVNEGRTIYANAADIAYGGSLDDTNTDKNKLTAYTDIYLMSYNQNAAASTIAIQNQMAANWLFNTGNETSGGLEFFGALGTCYKGETGAEPCLADQDCQARTGNVGLNFCTSDKAKITRDTKRLEDAQTINKALASYYNAKRCSNDFTRLCDTSSNCLGGGACGNYYPNMAAGSYINGKTLSVWPSWQSELGKALGVTLPVDPINQLWASTSPAGKLLACADPFDPISCWDKTAKTMYTGSSCKLEATSSVYVYYGNKQGYSSRVYMKSEWNPTNSISAAWRPFWNRVAGVGYNPFNNYAPSTFCSANTDTCGNNIVDSGETCSTCPLDVGCTGVQTCQKNAANVWACTSITAGNGIKDRGEECDSAQVGCTASSTCSIGYNCSGPSPKAICGDNIIVGSENCEFDPVIGPYTLSGSAKLSASCDKATCQVLP